MFKDFTKNKVYGKVDGIHVYIVNTILKKNFMINLNMKLFFIFDEPINSYSGIYRGIDQNKRKW